MTENIGFAELLPETGDFGFALSRLRAGKKVSRSGWNGKGMWLAFVSGTAWILPSVSDALIGVLGSERLPWIGMKTADNKFVPWLASQTDVLAEDWRVVE